MRTLKLLLISISFILIFSGCSEKESKETSALKPGSFQDLSGDRPGLAKNSGLGQEVAPIKISPEDQEKAKLAPEGMAFIKGGLFHHGKQFRPGG